MKKTKRPNRALIVSELASAAGEFQRTAASLRQLCATSGRQARQYLEARNAHAAGLGKVLKAYDHLGAACAERDKAAQAVAEAGKALSAARQALRDKQATATRRPS